MNSMSTSDVTVNTGDNRPLLDRLKTYPKITWVLVVLCVVLSIVLIVFIAGYAHCRDSLSDLQDQMDSGSDKSPHLEGDHCKDLSGAWYNNLGSEMILSLRDDGFLFGEYRTAVEREAGSAGGSHSIVVGAFPVDTPGAVFAYSVMWRGGMSMTTWTGQCLSCDGHETLITSWMLRSKQGSCIDKWKSTMVGQDVFTRHEQVAGPRRNFTDYKPSQELKDVLAWTPSADLDEKWDKKGLCNIDGPWTSDSGSEMTLTHEHGYIIEGKYRTSSEHRTNTGLPLTDSRIYGIGNSTIANTTVAMFVVYDGGKSLTGWTGQCHVCEDGEGQQEEVLEMAWMHRTQVPTCPLNWQATLYGQTTFRRPDDK